MEKEDKNKQSVPFLKWAGGKTQLLSSIISKFQFGKTDCFTYLEPFVGGGAVLFWVLNNYPNVQKVIINDLNKDLMATYLQVKENVEELISILVKLEQEYHRLYPDFEKKKSIIMEKE